MKWSKRVFLITAATVLLTIAAVIIIGNYYGIRDLVITPNVKYYWLDDLPGVANSTKDAVGQTFDIQEPIPVINNIARFSITPLIGSQKDQEIQFFGDAQLLNGFANEMQFVKLYIVQGNYELAKSTAIGFKEGVEDLFMGFWKIGKSLVTSLSSVADFKNAAAKTGVAASSAYDYLKAVFSGQRNIAEDFKELCKAYYASELCKTADIHNFSYPECKTRDGKKCVEYETWSRMGGHTTEEILAIMIPIGAAKWASKSAVAAELAVDASDAVVINNTAETIVGIHEEIDGFKALSKYPKAFPIISKVSSSLKRLASFKNAEATAAIIDSSASLINAARETIKNQSDLIKLSTLTTERAANPRYNRIMGAMYTLEKKGANLEQELNSLLPKGVQGEFYYSQTELKKSLLENYKYLKESCAMDEADISLLRRGNCIRILKGPHAGDITSIDHRIPKTYAPELDSNLNNLRVVPLKVNCARGARIDDVVVNAVSEYESLGWKPDESLTTAIRSANENKLMPNPSLQ